MEIVVDIGNTRTKIAVFKQAELQVVITETADVAKKVANLHGQYSFQSGIISSVSEDVLPVLEAVPSINWLPLNHQTDLPIINKYQSPETLGVDRIALACAAQTKYANQNVLVIDAGTCVTYDIVTAEGHYLGGAISPGLHMRLQAMHTFTSKLPKVDLKTEINLIGKTTTTSMQSGALYGLAAEIDGIIAQYSSVFENLIVVLTGGNTKPLANLVKSGIFARQNFLLEGLHAILKHNRY